MRERVVADFSGLPPHGMHTASPTWWGTLAFMLIEGTGFALAIAVYLYLMSLATTWPINSRRSVRNPPPTASVSRCSHSGLEPSTTGINAKL